MIVGKTDDVSWASVWLNEQDRCHFHFTDLLWEKNGPPKWCQNLSLNIDTDFKCMVFIWGISNIVINVISCISGKQMEGGLRWRTNAPILPSHSCLPLYPSCLCRTCIDRRQGQAKGHWVKAKLSPQTKPHYQSPGELGQTSDKSPIFLFGSNLLSTEDLCDLDQKGVEGQHTKSSYPLSLHLNLCLPRTRKGEPRHEESDRGRRGKGRGRGEEMSDSP